jgi:ubiquinone/menaquinone biosynthesis C-methylase UbiE
MENYKKTEKEKYDTTYTAHTGIIDGNFKKLFFHESENAFLNQLSKLIEPANDILEVGCGTAPVLVELTTADKRWHLIDISLNGLQSFSKHYPQLSEQNLLFQMDVEKLAYRDDTFNLIVDNELLSSVDPVKALPELFRVLQPGGILVLKETFGVNPIFNWYRKKKVTRGELHSWVAEHIFRHDYLKSIPCEYSIKSISYYHFLSVLLAPGLMRLSSEGLKGRIQKISNYFDRLFLNIPIVKLLGFKVILILEKH